MQDTPCHLGPTGVNECSSSKVQTRQIAGDLLGQGSLQICRNIGGWLRGGERAKGMQVQSFKGFGSEMH